MCRLLLIPFLLHATTLLADDTKSDAKAKAKPRQTFIETVRATVKDLTDEQDAKLKELSKSTSEKNKAILEKAGISWKENKKRTEIMNKLRGELKGQELFDEVNKQAGFTKEQAEAQKKIGEVWQQFRFAGMKVLTESQRKVLPDWIQSDYATQLKRAEKAAKAKAAKK